MPFPLVPVVAGLGLANIASQYLSGKAQSRFQDRQVRDQKNAARRAAIERAMGGTPIGRVQSQEAAPDTSNYAIGSGVANLLSTLAMQKYG